MRIGRTLRNIIIAAIIMILTMLAFLAVHAVCGQDRRRVYAGPPLSLCRTAAESTQNRR